MGVVLTTAAIVAAVSVGVWSERRWPQGGAIAARRALTLILYVLIPPVVFFNLAASELALSHGIVLLLGLLAISLAALLAWLVSTRVLALPRYQAGAVICSVLAV